MNCDFYAASKRRICFEIHLQQFSATNFETQTNHRCLRRIGHAIHSNPLTLSLSKFLVGQILAVNPKQQSWLWNVSGVQFKSAGLYFTFAMDMLFKMYQLTY